MEIFSKYIYFFKIKSTLIKNSREIFSRMMIDSIKKKKKNDRKTLMEGR